MTQTDVSVVVVSYNTRAQLQRCLAAIEPEHEVVVVDNGSSDGSPAMVRQQFPNVRLIANNKNHGFGVANNQGAVIASRPLILYLNSDAYAEPGAIARLAKVFEDQGVVAAGGRLLNLDGSLQNSSAGKLSLWAVLCEQLYLEKLFRGSPLFSPYWNTARLVEQPSPAETEQVMGACLMTRKGLESFDDRYFMYCEDTDLCYRLRRHGRIVYVKNATFTHELGASSSSDPVKGVLRYNAGKELFFAIHRGTVPAFLCLLLDRIGALCRWVFWTFRSAFGGGDRARALSRGFLGVLTAPRRGPIRS